jgi:hypothetical protein
MATFITRVELHHASTADDYQRLHNAMATQGFSRTIKSDNGTAYHLPTAEYYFIGSFTTRQVLDKAKAAANTIGKTFMVITFETLNGAWEGLLQAS